MQTPGVPDDMNTGIMVSASSDIGFALSERLLDRGMRMFGTFRRKSRNTERLKERGMQLVACDLSDRRSILDACAELRLCCDAWDVLVQCSGLQDPICPFAETDFDAWERSVSVNFSGPLQTVRELLPRRRPNARLEPIVLFFAGGGPNKATLNYSAYSVSKVALIKMTELLDAEMPDVRFVTLNPGWVKTKGHENMLRSGGMSAEDYQRTLERFATADWTPMERVMDCCEWAIGAPRSLVSGRYFGVKFDDWGSSSFSSRTIANRELFKLRRCE